MHIRGDHISVIPVHNEDPIKKLNIKPVSKIINRFETEKKFFETNFYKPVEQDYTKPIKLKFFGFYRNKHFSNFYKTFNHF